MKRLTVLVFALAALAGFAAADAPAATCPSGDRACWRVMLLRHCVPLNPSYTAWACPDQPPRAKP